MQVTIDNSAPVLEEYRKKHHKNYLSLWLQIRRDRNTREVLLFGLPNRGNRKLLREFVGFNKTEVLRELRRDCSK